MKKVSRLFCVIVLSALFLPACTLVQTLPLIGNLGGDKSIELNLAVSAAENVNPDDEGIPSPIEIRFYQLRSSAEFESSDFFSIYNNESLKSSLLKEKIFILTPGEKKELVLDLDESAQYVGVLAAFQDIDNAKWNDLMIVRDSRGIIKKLFTSNQVVSVEVAVADKTVVLSEHRGYGADWL